MARAAEPFCRISSGSLYSARNGADWDQLLTALDAFVQVETSAAHVARALQVQRLLAERSKRGGKIPDLLVAAAAEELSLTVLHYDADFDLIAEVTGQASQWVVPAGTIPAVTPPRPGPVIFRQQVWTQGYPFLVTERGLDVRRQGHHGH